MSGLNKTDRKLLQQALDALEAWDARGRLRIIDAIRTRLAQPEPEPVAYGFQNTAVTGRNRWLMLREEVPTDDQYDGQLWTPLYTAPPKKEWVGLTDEEIYFEMPYKDTLFEFARAIEAKLKEKNT